MNDKLNIMLDHRTKVIEYRERFVYNILDENENQLLRVVVHIIKSGDDYQIYGAGFRTDPPLPEGISSEQYLDVLRNFEKQEFIRDISYHTELRPTEYAINNNTLSYTLATLPEDPECENEIAKWLLKSIDTDSLHKNILDIFDTIRNEAVSSEEKKIDSNSREKSNSGVEDDIT